MDKLIEYPSIEKFSDVLEKLQWKRDNQGYTDDFDFYGTVKLHGTNAGVVYDRETGNITCQNRNNILSLEKDNQRFYAWINREDRMSYLKDAFEAWGELFTKYENKPVAKIAFFGEYGGKGIQHGVAINEMERFFSIFETWIIFQDGTIFKSKNISIPFIVQSTRIFPINYININLKFTLKNDFSNLEECKLYMEKALDEVTNECPFAKQFGDTIGFGKGIVWHTYLNNGEMLQCKTKSGS